MEAVCRKALQEVNRDFEAQSPAPKKKFLCKFLLGRLSGTATSGT